MFNRIVAVQKALSHNKTFNIFWVPNFHNYDYEFWLSSDENRDETSSLASSLTMIILDESNMAV